MKIKIFLLAVFFILPLLNAFGQEVKVTKNGDKMTGTMVDPFTGETITRSVTITGKTTGGTSTSTESSFAERSDAANAQNDADIAVTQSETRQYDENLRAISEEVVNTPIRSRFSGFKKMTPEQQRAFDYFLSLEIKPLKDINVQGLGSMQRVPDALKKAQEAIAANDYTKAMAYFKQEAEVELPNRIIGEIPTNSLGNTKYVDLDKFKQLPPDEKQKVYNNTLSQLEAKNNEKSKLYNELNELIQIKKQADDTYKNIPNEKRNNTEVVKKQNDIQQTFNKNSMIIINEKADNEIEIRNLQKQIDEMKGICPNCYKNN